MEIDYFRIVYIMLDLFILKYIVNMSWNDYSNVGSNHK